MEASAAPDVNLDTTRPAMGRFFCPPVPPACPPISLHSPATSRCLRGLLWSPGGIFALVSSRVEQTSKKQNLRKDHLQALRAVLLSWSVPIFQYHKTPYIGPQNAKQSTKHPRPAPSGASRGLIICSGPRRGRHNALYRRPTRRSGGRHNARRYTPRGASCRRPGT